ncbi:MAG: hypothetical protein HQL69_01700 [Magnetococcales bacterium]|nr:hypothetical protein [Magnetococcales bacterium]
MMNVVALVLLGSIACVLDLFVVYLLDTKQITLIWFLFLHLGVVLVFLLPAIYFFKKGRESKQWFLITISTAFLGPLGVVGSLFCMFVYLVVRHSSTPFEKWYTQIFPERELVEHDQLFAKLERVHSNQGQVENIVPFQEVFSFGSLIQKQTAIALITKRFHPAFSTILKMAVRDENNAIRVQAASAIAHIENQFTTRSVELGLTLKKDQENPEILYSIAKHYDDYAFSGLADRDSMDNYRKQALQAYRKVFAIWKDDKTIFESLIRLLLRSDLCKEAVTTIEQFIANSKEEPSKKMVLWYMEALYREKQYGKLRQVARQNYQYLTSQINHSLVVREVLELWGGIKHEQTAPLLPVSSTDP